MDVFIEIGIFDSVALVVVVQDVPESFLRTVVKVRPGDRTLRRPGVLNEAMSESFLVIRKRPRAEKSD